MHYPPVTGMVNVVVRGRTFEKAMSDAAELASWTREHAGRFKVLGPAPAPLARLKGEHRAQFFLKGARADMRASLRAALARVPDVARRASVDVDPVTLL
jgi:primosomal protein N' (replication factor Y)